MATLVVKKLALAGVNPAAVAASAGGDTLPNSRGASILRVANGGGGSINVTVTAPSITRPADGQFPAMALDNLVVAVPAGEARLIGPVPPAYNTGGNAAIAYSGVSSVTVEAFEP